MFAGRNWVTICCTSAWQYLRVSVCACATPEKRTKTWRVHTLLGLSAHHPWYAVFWARKKIDFSAVFPFSRCSLRFMCAPFCAGVLRVLFGSCSAHLLGVPALYMGINYVRVYGWGACRERTLRLCVLGIVLTLLLELICSSICRIEMGLGAGQMASPRNVLQLS